MTCTNCGYEPRGPARFCARCGHALAGAEPEPRAVAPPAYEPGPGPSAPPNPYAPPDLTAPPSPYGVAPPPGTGTNGLAIAALVLGLVGWVVCIGSLLAVILGAVARNQIRRSGGGQQGAGMAKAGIILGAIGLVLWLVYLVLAVVFTSSSTDI